MSRRSRFWYFPHPFFLFFFPTKNFNSAKKKTETVARSNISTVDRSTIILFTGRASSWTPHSVYLRAPANFSHINGPPLIPRISSRLLEYTPSAARFPSTVVGKLSDFSGFYRLEIISLSITSPQLPLSPRKFNVRSTCAPIDRDESPGEGGRLACKQLQGELSLSPTLPEFVYLLK